MKENMDHFYAYDLVMIDICDFYNLYDLYDLYDLFDLCEINNFSCFYKGFRI